MPSITDPVRIVSIPTGEGLTSASITGLTPAILSAYNLTEHNKAKAIAYAQEARAIGVIGSTRKDMLLSRFREISKDRLVPRPLPGMQSQILPYSYYRRKNRIGNATFKITAGAANPNAGTTAGGIVYPDSAWDITVTIGDGYVSDVTDLARYFKVGSFVYVESYNASTKAKTTTPFAIVTVANTTNGSDGKARAIVTVRANRTDTWWSTATSDEKLPYQPEYGVVILGNNNLKDYQSGGENEPVNLSQSWVVKWHQTTRYTQISTDVYEQVLKSIMNGEVNDMAATASYLDIAEQNRQMVAQHEEKWYNDLWFSDILDERQEDPNDYATLEPEVDPLDPSVTLGFVTRAEGFYTLLYKDNRVFDMAGGPLNISEMLENLYQVYRARKANGDNASIIPLATDKDTAHVLRRAFRKIQSDVYGVTTNIQVPQKEVLMGVKVQFKFEIFEIPGMPYSVGLYVDEFYTDRLAAFGTSSADLQNSGRTIEVIDWNSLHVDIIATNQAKREFGGKTAADVLASLSKVIKLNPKTINMRSITWTCWIDGTATSSIWQNFSLEAPIYTAVGDAVNYS